MTHSKPIFMGAFMGLMMLAMLHQTMTNETDKSFLALALFAGAHIAIISIASIGAVFMARLSPRARGWIARLHRPSLAHVGAMLASATVFAGLAHLFIHGGLI